MRAAPTDPIPSTTPEISGVWSRRHRATTAGLVLTITVVAFEALAVITILPLVSADLGGIGLYGWVVSAFSLGTLFGIVAGGKEADRRGPATPYLAGLALFAAGLVLGGLAPSMPVLVGARAVQGVGAGIIPSVAYASISRTYDSSLHPRVFAVTSTAWVVPGLIAPGLAALVAVHLGWRVVFLGLLPFVLAGAILTTPPLRRLGPPPSATAPVPGRLRDALRVAAGTGLTLAGLDLHHPLATPLMVLIGAAVGVGPLLRLLPGGTLRARRGLPAAVLARGLLTFGFFGADTFIPLTLTSVRGQSTTVAGITVTIATLSWTAGAWLQERTATRLGARTLVTLGFCVLLAGIAVVSTMLIPAVPVACGVAGWLLGGLGIGLAYAQISVAVLREAPPGREGASSAALQLTDTLGIALGSGLGGVALAVGETTGSGPRMGIGVAFALAAAVSTLGIVVGRRLSMPSRG